MTPDEIKKARREAYDAYSVAQTFGLIRLRNARDEAVARIQLEEKRFAETMETAARRFAWALEKIARRSNA